MTHCPKCLSKDIQRTHREGWELWFSPILGSAWWCRKCGKRYRRLAKLKVRIVLSRSSRRTEGQAVA